jgi:Bacteriophage clamp loader A subunit
MSGAWEFIAAVNAGKDIIKSGEQLEKNYDPYITNRNYSLFVDTVMYANEINKCYQMDKKLQFDYYLNSLRPMKRYAKWLRKEKIEDIEDIMKFYKVSYSKASDISKVLTQEQKQEIRIRIKGGANDNR